MTTFIDTSAFFAILDRDDINHERAAQEWLKLLEADSPLVTTNYVLVETFALVQRRLGIHALNTVVTDVLPVVDQECISPRDHESSLGALLGANRRDLSFVDMTSFHVMRRLGIRAAFGFDRHFEEHGFNSLPSP